MAVLFCVSYRQRRWRGGWEQLLLYPVWASCLLWEAFLRGRLLLWHLSKPLSPSPQSHAVWGRLWVGWHVPPAPPQGVASALWCAICFWINSGVLRASLPGGIGPWFMEMIHLACFLLVNQSPSTFLAFSSSCILSEGIALYLSSEAHVLHACSHALSSYLSL